MYQSTQTKISNHQSGNVIFIILIGVALFAALSSAVMSTSSIRGNDLSQETNEVLANQLIEQATALRTAYKRLRLMNCNLLKGGVRATSVPIKIFEQDVSPLDWRHASSLRVSGVGTEDEFELSLVIQGLIREDICKVLNQKLIGTESIPVLNTNLDIRTYDGTFPTSNWDYLNDPLTFSRHMACIDVDYNGERKNAFYVILEAR